MTRHNPIFWSAAPTKLYSVLDCLAIAHRKWVPGKVAAQLPTAAGLPLLPACRLAASASSNLALQRPSNHSLPGSAAWKALGGGHALPIPLPQHTLPCLAPPPRSLPPRSLPASHSHPCRYTGLQGIEAAKATPDHRAPPHPTLPYLPLSPSTYLYTCRYGDLERIEAAKAKGRAAGQKAKATRDEKKGGRKWVPAAVGAALHAQSTEPHETRKAAAACGALLLTTIMQKPFTHPPASLPFTAPHHHHYPHCREEIEAALKKAGLSVDLHMHDKQVTRYIKVCQLLGWSSDNRLWVGRLGCCAAGRQVTSFPAAWATATLPLASWVIPPALSAPPHHLMRSALP